MKNDSMHPARRAVVNATLAVGLLSASHALAASATWSATPTDANFTTPANWSTNAVPGINPTANSTNTNDVITFNSDPTGGFGTTTPLSIDANRMVGSVLFDTASVGAFNIGVDASQTLEVVNGGNVTLTAAVLKAQKFNALLALHLPSSTNGAFTIQNNATSTSAVLDLAGGLGNAVNSTRGTVWTLGGSNTGNNVVSGVINLTNNGGVASSILKTGAGTWTLTNSNTIVGGVTVNQGLLVATTGGAFGSAAAGSIRATGTGTLKIDNTTLSTGGATLDQTGRILTNGSTALNAVAIAATATDVTLETTNAGDVFNVGASTGVTGGAAASNVHIAGPGAVTLNNASTYVGSYSIDAGRLSVGNATGLGSATTANVKFGAGSTGALELNSVSPTIVGLQGTAAGSFVRNSVGGNTLTINNAAANQYGGVIENGSGQMSIVKGANGVLALTGANTYTGTTTVNAGTLLANNASGSATGTGAVSASGNAVVGGNGRIGGSLNLAATAHLAPGAASGLTGTLHVGSLTLGSGTNLDYDINSTSDMDRTIVDNTNGLTINGGTVNINGAASAFTTNGVYNLIGYSGSIGGTGLSALALNAANKSPATNSYTFGTAGGFVTLTVASTGGSIAYWNADANGNWSTGPWTAATPNGVGAFAAFGGGGTPITANRTISVDTSKTVGTISFNNTTGQSYTIAGPGTLTLDGGAGVPAFITDAAGSHTISAPVALVNNGTTVTVTNAADTLTVSGAVSGAGAAISKLGAGTLALTNVNTFGGGTNLQAGTIQINSGDSLGASTGGLNFSGGTLQLLADVTTTRTYTADSNDSDIKLNTNGFNLTQNGNIAAVGLGQGGVVKNGGGTLTLGGTNTYLGQTTINAGTLVISSNANLGEQTVGSALNLGSGTTLISTATAALNNGAVGTNDRAVTIGATGATVDVADATSLTISGAVTGGTLTKVNTGTLVLTNTANTAPLTISAGTFTAGGTAANTNGGFGSGAITLQGGATINTSMPAGNSLGFANVLTVPAGQTGNLVTPNRFVWSGAVNGGGTLNVTSTTNTQRLDFSNNWAGFTGTLNIGGTGAIRLLANGGGFNTAGLAGAIVDLGGTVILNPSNNSGGNTYQFGALSGSSTTANLGTPTQGGASTWQIGALNIDTTYAGLITSGNVTKVGAGKLTLTNANSYGGLTNINGGTLAINGQFALGGAVYGGMTLNGGTLQYTTDLPTANNGGSDITADSTGVAKPVTLNANGGTFDTNGNDVTFANVISGTGSLAKAGAGKLTISTLPTYTGATIVRGGTLALSSAARSIVTNSPGYAQVDGGKLTLAYDGGAVSSPIASIKAQIDESAASGFTTGQFRSTAIAANRTLGYGDNGLDTITVMFTIPGDADLNGKVDFNDFLVLQNNFNGTGKTFGQGNFNFDNVTDFNDFLVLQNNFNSSLPGLSVTPLTASQVAAVQSFAAAVPEPTLIACMGLGAAAMLRRRRGH